MSENRRTKYNVQKNILLTISIFIVVGVILISFKFLQKNNINNVSGGILQEGVIPGYTEEEIKEILQRKADESTFSFEINSRPIFKNGRSEGNLRIANPPYNKYGISVEIKLDLDGKTIFKSGKISPNHYIENAKLSKNLKAGEYDATAIINAYDEKTGDFKGTSAAKLVIKIEN